MDNVVKVENLIKAGQFSLNPRLAVEYKVKLAGEYSFFTGILEDVLKRKPKWWNDNRPKQKSDKATDKLFEQTDDGINEMGLRLRIKRCEKLINALGTLIRIAEGEAKNLY